MCRRVKVQRHSGIRIGLWEEVSIYISVCECECYWVEAGGGWTSRKACVYHGSIRCEETANEAAEKLRKH